MRTSQERTPDAGMQMNWREHLRLIGKQGFIRAEMIRLGFWPPSEEVAQQAETAEAQLRELYDELAKVRGELNDIEKEIRDSQDISKLLVEIRRRRIERVRAERARKKVERAEQREEARLKEQEWRRSTLPFLGRGVSAGLNYEEVISDAKTPVVPLSSAADVAQAIGISEQELAFLTYHRQSSAVDHYHRFTIPKRRGGTRVISSPKKKLRAAQTWVLQSVLKPVEIHEAATAFCAGCSIVDNAARHAGKAVVLRIDLKDFFPSIGFYRVKNMFGVLGYNEGVSTILALLSTEAPRVATTLDGEQKFVAIGNRCLPQGACTSPAITNILCRRMDARLTGAARHHGFTYSRYADDLIFSSNNKDALVGSLLGLVQRIVVAEKFTINDEKTLVMRPQHRQAVTGLVVNETARVSRNDMRRFRAFLHQYEKVGREKMTEKLGQDALAYAAGYLSFIHMVNLEQEAQIRAAHPWLERRQQPKA